LKSENLCFKCEEELPVCGKNGLLDADFIGCGQIIWDVKDLYRCTDCDVPFHKQCAQKHFDKNNVLTEDVVEKQEKRWAERAAKPNAEEPHA